jgi:site-specific DNA-methyltransferase (adenine-specific)
MNKIFNEDCFKTIERIQSKTVDTILTSPPYNTGGRVEYWSNKIIEGKRVYSIDKRYDKFLDTQTEEEYLDWSVGLFNAYNSILKKDGVILYNLSYGNENPNTMWLLISKLISETEFMVADCIVWKKSNALPNTTSKNKLTRICEFVFVIVRKTEFKTYNTNKKVTTISKVGQNFYSVFYNFIEAKNNDKCTKINKATFSTDFAIQLLDMYTKDGGVVYDSFMGTGTVANACIEADRGLKFIGSELSKEQCEYAEKRVKEKIKEKEGGNN